MALVTFAVVTKIIAFIALSWNVLSTDAFVLHAARAPRTFCTPLIQPRALPVLFSQKPEEPPLAVIEAERQATPMRKYRFIGIGVLGALCAASGLLCAFAISGQPDALDLAEDLLPFGNPYISLVGDVAIGGTCVWAFQQELQTREQNVQRIWEEVQRRKQGGGVPAKGGGNRSNRRATGVAKSAKSAKIQMQPRAKPASPAPASESSSPPPPPAPAAAPPAEGSGLFKQAQSFLDEANNLARAQAIQLNDDLEKRGMLPQIEKQPQSESAESSSSPQTEASAPQSTDASSERSVASSDLAGAETLSSSNERGKKSGSKKRGKGKGGKRKR
eukprot:3359727-Pleurochrysis_carterae.AAC.8